MKSFCRQRSAEFVRTMAAFGFACCALITTTAPWAFADTPEAEKPAQSASDTSNAAATTDTSAITGQDDTAQGMLASSAGNLAFLMKPPYKYWLHHTGEPADCVALVRAGNDPPVTALVIRCDGMMIVPKRVADSLDDGRVVTVGVTRADGGEPDGSERLDTPIPLAGRIHMVVSPSRVDYSVVKINDHHIRCLRLLAARNVFAGLPVHIVCAVPDPSEPAHCRSVTVEGVVGAARDDIHWELKRDSAASPEPIPSGAAVIDPESGAAVGIVTGASGIGGGVVFSTFAHFSDLSNEVGVEPTREVAKQVRNPDAPGRILRGGELAARAAASVTGTLWKPGEMVRVKGGPILLEGALRAEIWKAFHTSIACVPDFYIDVYPVSLAEYRIWLLMHPNVPPPQNWGRGELLSPERRPDLPATGMPIQQAVYFADTQDARLVTATEWQRAARAPMDGSANALIQSEADANEYVMRKLRAFSTALREQERAELAQMARYAQAGHGTMAMAVLPNSLLSFAFSDLMSTITNNGRQESGLDWMHLPRKITPLDQYDGDVSIFGVRHVTMNAPEMLAPRGSRNVFAPKPYPALLDPYDSWIDAEYDISFLALSTGNSTGNYAMLYTKGSYHKRVSELKPEDGLAWLAPYGSIDVRSADMGGDDVRAPVTNRGPYSTPTSNSMNRWHYYIVMNTKRHIDPGFRCAR